MHRLVSDTPNFMSRPAAVKRQPHAAGVKLSSGLRPKAPLALTGEVGLSQASSRPAQKSRNAAAATTAGPNAPSSNPPAPIDWSRKRREISPLALCAVRALSRRTSVTRDRPEVAENSSSMLLQVAAVQGGRPPWRQARPPLTVSDFRLLGNLKRVIDLDAEVPHGGLQLGVPRQKLHGA